MLKIKKKKKKLCIWDQEGFFSSLDCHVISVIAACGIVCLRELYGLVLFDQFLPVSGMLSIGLVHSLQEVSLGPEILGLIHKIAFSLGVPGKR